MDATPTLPNRSVAGTAVIASIVTALGSVLGLVPDAQKALVLVAALVCGTAVAIVWLIGWQKHEARQHDPLNGDRF